MQRQVQIKTGAVARCALVMATAVSVWSGSNQDLKYIIHHGDDSRPDVYTVSDNPLDDLRPRVAIASLGARNPFGYPHPEVVSRYEGAGAMVLRTDRDGTVEVATDGQRLWVRTSGEALERRIR